MLHVIIPEFISDKEILFKKDTFIIKAYGYIDRLSSIVVAVNDRQYVLEVNSIGDTTPFEIDDLINIKEPVDITLKHYCGNVFIIESIQSEDISSIDTESISDNVELVNIEDDTRNETVQTNDSESNNQCYGTSGPLYRLKRIMF